jgi:type II secretion system protein G
MRITYRGFTLIELLVVVSIIGIIAAVVFANVNEGGAQARDAERQADLRNLQSALELYKNRYGRYPDGCQGADAWSWQSGVGSDCPSGTQYIVGLAPEFIRALPVDPKPAGNGTGYAYRVNTDGSVYKLVVFRTVEEMSAIDSTTASKLSEELGGFRLCPYVNGLNTAEFLLCSGRADAYGPAGSYSPPNYRITQGCDWNFAATNDLDNSYAIWGGYANGLDERQTRVLTERVICVKP